MLKEDRLDILEDNDFIEILKHNRFHHLLLRTEKYKDLLWSKEALLCLVLSVFLTYLLASNTVNNEANIISLYIKIIPFFMISLFIIFGLSLIILNIVLLSIDEKTLKIIVKQSKIKTLMSILFIFYFLGFIALLSFGLLGLSYIFLSIGFQIVGVSYFVLLFSNIYLVLFSVIYAFMVTGTTLRFFFVKHSIIASQK